MLGSRNFFRGAGSRPGGQKTVWTTFFVVFVFAILVLNLQRAPTGLITEKTILSKDPGGGGGPSFSRGATFSTGVQILIYIETHIT